LVLLQQAEDQPVWWPCWSLASLQQRQDQLPDR